MEHESSSMSHVYELIILVIVFDEQNRLLGTNHAVHTSNKEKKEV